MKHLLGGILLVAGTSIGAGMLALPVVTAMGGFLPAFFVYLCSWLFMTATGLLLLELCLKLPPDANLVTMASSYLGIGGKISAWILYLFLFYCLSIAYVSGGAGLISGWTGFDLFSCQLFFVFGLAIPICFGAWMVDRINWIFMFGLIASYLIFATFGLTHVEFANLERADWGSAWVALPVIFTSFSYQGIIPSLTAYMKRDAKKLRMAIIGGTSLCFVIYLVWEFLILGIIPVDALVEAKELGQTAVAPLKSHLRAPRLVLVGQFFAFFAIATSFLGVNLGLFDFLADGLKITKKGARKAFLVGITFLPPLAISLVSPSLFITALVLAGGVGCALLLGLLPVLMTWVSRYLHEGHRGPIQLFGGKLMLGALFLFVILELVLEVIPSII